MGQTRPELSSPACQPRGSSHRDPGDDFYCLRFGVWYASFDCAVRTRYRTCEGCRNCEQGRFNFKRHAQAVGRLRTLATRPR